MSNPATTAYEFSGKLITSAGLTEVKRAFASSSSIGTFTVVPAVSERKLRVLYFYMTTANGLNAVFKSSATTISGNMAAAGITSSYCPHGICETAAGEALGLDIDAAEATSVHVVYVEVI